MPGNGEGRLVSHCGDGDVGEGNGGGFGEGRERGRKFGGQRLGLRICNCVEKGCSACAELGHLTQLGEAVRDVGGTTDACPGGASMCGMSTCLTSSCNRTH